MYCTILSRTFSKRAVRTQMCLMAWAERGCGGRQVVEEPCRLRGSWPTLWVLLHGDTRPSKPNDICYRPEQRLSDGFSPAANEIFLHVLVQHFLWLCQKTAACVTANSQNTRRGPTLLLSFANFMSVVLSKSRRGYEMRQTGHGGGGRLPPRCRSTKTKMFVELVCVVVCDNNPPLDRCVRNHDLTGPLPFLTTHGRARVRVVPGRRTERKMCEMRQNVKRELPYLKVAGAVFNHLQRLQISFSCHSLAPECAEAPFLWIHGGKIQLNSAQRSGVTTPILLTNTEH